MKLSRYASGKIVLCTCVNLYVIYKYIIILYNLNGYIVYIIYTIILSYMVYYIYTRNIPYMIVLLYDILCYRMYILYINGCIMYVCIKKGMQVAKC